MAVCYKKFDCFYDLKDFSNPPAKDYKIHASKCFICQKRRYFPLRNILIRHFLNQYADKIVTVSNELKKLIETNGIRVSKVIYNGVDADNFKISEGKILDFRERFSLENKKIVLFGGRMTKVKGGGQLLEAMELVCKKESSFWLLILAKKEDEYVKLLIDKAKGSGINILVTGWLEGEDLIAAFNSADLVVTPSIYLDAFGLMSIEALACKKPVITSCFSGGKEIVVQGEDGYIVNPFDIAEFARKILSILGDDKLAQKMGNIGWETVKEKFELEKIAREYLEIMEQI